MTTLSKKVRAQLGQTFSIKRPTVSEKQTSIDGTIKWLLEFEDGAKTETVFIPEEDKGHIMHIVSGRVHAQLLILPHGHADLSEIFHHRVGWADIDRF